MALMNEIREASVPTGAVAIWWLGQSGYIFKSPGGTVVGVDLYLTDSCAAIAEAQTIDLRRQVPVMIRPEELDVDVFACTHNHQDHTDPETIRALGCKKTALFVGPHPSCEVFLQLGISAQRIHPSWPDCEIHHCDITLRGTWALPTDASDLNHMGFVLEFGEGPKVYITGDTDDSPLLASAAKFAPDVMIAVINGGFNNLSAWEAAELAKKIRPKVAIPSHYDMFADNAIDPKQFGAALRVAAPGVEYRELKYGEAFVYSRS
ncbi:MAG: MBL fold metallo-hydrolase [Acidobacteriales bacterium]|nr:MBL fold metallo-hydrolase [Terriglobales bacterium]